MRVLKIGGNQLDDADFVAGFARAVVLLTQSGQPPVIVHGGGRAIAQLQEQLGLPVEKVEGLRVTNAAARDVVEMVLSGHSNKRLTAALVSVGVEALGLSGIDRGVLRCRKKRHPTADLGFVGEITTVRTEVLEELVTAGITPVLSPFSLGPDGHGYNVNADEVAAAVAVALKARQLVFVSDVPGILVQGAVVPTLTPTQAEGWITEGIIEGGMAVKVRSALEALERGVERIRIVDLEGVVEGGSSLVAAAPLQKEVAS